MFMGHFVWLLSGRVKLERSSISGINLRTWEFIAWRIGSLSLIDSGEASSSLPKILSHIHQQSNLWGKQYNSIICKLVNLNRFWLLGADLKWCAFLNRVWIKLLHFDICLVFSQEKNLN